MAALVVAVLGGVLARTGSPTDHRAPTVLPLPGPREVQPQVLGDGRPVFVVRLDDGTVSVVDAISSHDPFGLPKLLVWCPGLEGFEDTQHGSRFTAEGRYAFGPAPTGLRTYAVTVDEQPPGRVVVGAARAPAARGAGARLSGVGYPARTSPAGSWQRRTPSLTDRTAGCGRKLP